jgi:Protein of unknown function (DUF2397)
VRVTSETDDRLSNGLERLVGNIPADRLRFLTSDRRSVYAAILWLLLNHRRSHEIEVYYDDLLVEVLGIISTVDPGPHTPEDFRSDVRQLVEWGNLAPLLVENAAGQAEEERKTAANDVASREAALRALRASDGATLLAREEEAR